MQYINQVFNDVAYCHFNDCSFKGTKTLSVGVLNFTIITTKQYFSLWYYRLYYSLYLLQYANINRKDKHNNVNRSVLTRLWLQGDVNMQFRRQPIGGSNKLLGDFHTRKEQQRIRSSCVRCCTRSEFVI